MIFGFYQNFGAIFDQFFLFTDLSSLILLLSILTMILSLTISLSFNSVFIKALFLKVFNIKINNIAIRLKL